MHRYRERSRAALTGGGECFADEKENCGETCRGAGARYRRYLAAYYAELARDPRGHAETLSKAGRLLEWLDENFHAQPIVQ
jgi:hypothetical protein